MGPRNVEYLSKAETNAKIHEQFCANNLSQIGTNCASPSQNSIFTIVINLLNSTQAQDIHFFATAPSFLTTHPKYNTTNTKWHHHDLSRQKRYVYSLRNLPLLNGRKDEKVISYMKSGI